MKGTTAGARFFKKQRVEERDREEDALLGRALAGKLSHEETVRQLQRLAAENAQLRADREAANEKHRKDIEQIKAELTRPSDSAMEENRRQQKLRHDLSLKRKQKSRDTLRAKQQQLTKQPSKASRMITLLGIKGV